MDGTFGLRTVEPAAKTRIIGGATQEAKQTMREQMQTRLEALRKEFETGQAELEKVERHLTCLRQMILRISGAIQVLEELLTQGQPAGHNGSRPYKAQAAFEQGTNEANVQQTTIF